MPNPKTDPKPNEEAGKKMLADNGGVIDIDSDTIRAAARTLQARAEALSPIKTRVDGINSSADSESETFISQHAPKDVYSTAVGSLKSVLTRFGSETDKAVSRLQTKAGALMWIADQHDSTETENKDDMENIPDEQIQTPTTTTPRVYTT